MPKFRNIARLVVLEGQVRTSRGDWNGAASCYIDAMSFGNKIQRGGNIIHGLLGVAVESIARANLWDTINQLNADEAKVVITRIEEIEASRAPFADILQEEKWSMTASIIEMFKAPNQRRQFSSTSTSLIKSLIMQPARSIKTYTRYMDDCIAEARKPYILRRDVVVPDEPITQAFGSVRKQGHFVFTYRQYTLDSLLKTMLALHAYKLEHNKYPKSLSELVPGYLKKLPDDPFAAYKPLQYKQAGKKYLLYSIGPDGKDNGGKPVFHLSKSDPSERFSAQHDSRGDIVAGVNTIR